MNRKIKQKGDRAVFFKESMGNIRDVGSLVPSSHFLARKLVAPIRPNKALTVVELGAGTGSITKLILDAMPQDARLLSIEINPNLAFRLKSAIKDERCEVLERDARELKSILAEKGIEKADYIISGIPLGSLALHTRLAIYEQIKSCLKSDGTYTQFQYFMSNFAEIKKHFKVSHLSFEWRNLPPAFVYTCNLL